MTTPRCSIAHCNEPGVLCFLVRTRAARHSDDTPTAGYAWACSSHSSQPAQAWAEVTRVRDDDGRPKAGRGL